MKRILCFVIAVCLAASCCLCAADDSLKSFSPEKTGLLKYSAQEWTSSFGNRSILTVLLTLDFAYDTGFSVDKIDFASGAFIIEFGKDVLGVFLRIEDGSTLLLTYAPAASTASYDQRNDVPVDAKNWKGSVENMTGYTTYFVPHEAIYEVIVRLSEMLKQ